MKSPRRTSMRFRLVVLLIAGVAPVMLSAILYIAYRAAWTLRREAERSLALTADNLANNAERWDSSLVLALENLRSQNEIESMDAAKQRPVLARVARVYGPLTVVTTVDTHGSSIASSNGMPSASFAASGWFQEAMAGKSICRASHAGDGSQLPYVTVAAPIQNDAGEIRGVIAFNTSLDNLSKQIKTIRLGQTGYVFVTDEKGQVVAHADPKFTRALTDMSGFAPVAQGLAHRRAASLAFTDARGTRWLSHTVPVSNGWSVVSLQQEDEVLEEASDFLSMAVGVTAITLLLVIAGVWIMTGRLTRPIAALTAAAQAISEGRWDGSVPDGRTDELGILARAFDKMRDDLQRTYRTIEDKVARRTSELLQSNSQLELARSEVQRNMESLSEAQALLQSVTDASPEGVMAFRSIRSADGRIADFEWLLANPAAESAMGRPQNELLGHRLLECESWLNAGGLFELFVQTVEAGTPLDQERVYMRGQSRDWFHFSAVKLNDGFAVTFSNITRQKQEQLLEVDRRIVLEMVAENNDIDEVLQRLVTMMENQCRGMSASLMVLENGKMRQVAAASLPRAFVEGMDEHTMRLAVQLRAAAAGGCETVACTQLDGEAFWPEIRALAQAHGLNACWSEPIIASSADMLGMLVLYGAELREPGFVEFQSLHMVSKLAAIAIEHRQLADQLTHRAQHDPLTGLPNRVLFEDRLFQALGLANRNAERVGLFYIDLDRFKYINDTLGHHAGDELLGQVTERWSLCMRQTDTLARMGGDEFAVVLPDLGDRTGALRIAERLMDALRVPFHIADTELHVTGSIGISVFPEDGVDGHTLQRNADAAMYRAKNLGRNGIQCFAPEMNDESIERLAIEGQLRHALECGEFQLYYQPQVSIERQLVGFEALVRWNHPRRGLVPPAKFIALAEETGLIVPIGDWVLREACRQCKVWQDAGREAITVSLNVSPMQFARPDFVDTIISAINATGVNARSIKLELTESLLMSCTEDAICKLLRIRELGVEVAIDDFGTGYSSLAYLQKLPIQALKIDRSFVREIISPQAEGTRTNISSSAVIRAITSLAHSLGMKVVAEGVETDEQRALLGAIGCDLLQGFLFGKPVPADETAVFFERSRAPPAAMMVA